MYGRPRCREWTPLATQQLRLRSLIQIVGYNIRPPETDLTIDGFYYTLHATTMSSPFYTSEKILSPHPKWREIDSDVQKMTSANVIVRLWCHVRKHALNKEQTPPIDILVETWGVYFSGLRLMGANSCLDFTSDMFKTNTLVFQMAGGYFCSYKSLKFEPVSDEKSSYSSGSSSATTSCLKIPPRKYNHGNTRSLSPVTWDTFRNDDERHKGKSKRTRYVDSESKRLFYEHSPDSDIKVLAVSEDSERTALSDNAVNDSDDIQKIRHLSMRFLNSEIRPSYNADKLQKLHVLQYSIMKKKLAVNEIKEAIYKKSAMKDADVSDYDECLSRLKSKSRRNLFDFEVLCEETTVENSAPKETTGFPSNGQRFSLKLNDLLSLKSKPSPLERLEHTRLTKQLEILRFKKLILADERDSKLRNIRRLKERKNKVLEENQDLGLELLHQYHSLSKLSETKHPDLSELNDRVANLTETLNSQRLALLNQMQYVFPIKKEMVASRLTSMANESLGASWSGALCAISYIIGAHIRYPIRLYPYAIYDTHHDQMLLLHGRINEQTLSRGTALLSRSASQLAFMLGANQHIEHIRGLLPAIYAITHALSSQSSNSSSNRSAKDELRRSNTLLEPVRTRPFNRFKESTENINRSQTSSCATSIMSQEAESLIISPAQLLDSESYIKCSTESNPLKAHSSVNDLYDSNDSCQNKVVFTLGDGDGVKSLSDSELCDSDNRGESCEKI